MVLQQSLNDIVADRRPILEDIISLLAEGRDEQKATAVRALASTWDVDVTSFEQSLAQRVYDKILEHATENTITQIYHEGWLTPLDCKKYDGIPVYSALILLGKPLAERSGQTDLVNAFTNIERTYNIK